MRSVFCGHAGSPAAHAHIPVRIKAPVIGCVPLVYQTQAQGQVLSFSSKPDCQCAHRRYHHRHGRKRARAQSCVGSREQRALSERHLLQTSTPEAPKMKSPADVNNVEAEAPRSPPPPPPPPQTQSIASFHGHKKEIPSAPPPSPPFIVQPADIRTVSTAIELQRAVQEGVRDIEVTSHLDLRELDIPTNPYIVRLDDNKATHIMYIGTSTRSIRGNCGEGQRDLLERLQQATAGRVEYPPLKPHQCVLVMDLPFLYNNNATFWLDHLYCAVARTHVQPNFTMIQYGYKGTGDGHPGRSLYITNSTFVGEGRGSARAIATFEMSASVLIEDSILSSFSGEAPLAFLFSADAVIRRTRFRDFDLSAEIFDVSYGSTVLVEECTFTNITVPDSEYVSTSFNDYDSFRGSEVDLVYYPEDDGGPDFDIQRWRVRDSDTFETGVDTRVERQVMSDCLFRREDNLPGCPEPLSKNLKADLNRKSVIRQGVDINTAIAGSVKGDKETGEPLTPADIAAQNSKNPSSGSIEQYESYEVDDSDYTKTDFLSSDDDWMTKTRQVLPSLNASPNNFDPYFPPPALDPPRELPEMITAGTILPFYPSDEHTHVLAPHRTQQGSKHTHRDDSESPEQSSKNSEAFLLTNIVGAALVLLCMLAVLSMTWLWRRHRREVPQGLNIRASAMELVRKQELRV